MKVHAQRSPAVIPDQPAAHITPDTIADLPGAPRLTPLAQEPLGLGEMLFVLLVSISGMSALAALVGYVVTRAFP